MKLPDANLLLYAVDETSARHGAARAWVEATLSGTETVALAWAVLLAFVRVSTRSAVFEVPLEADEALDYVDGWLDQPSSPSSTRPIGIRPCCVNYCVRSGSPAT